MNRTLQLSAGRSLRSECIRSGPIKRAGYNAGGQDARVNVQIIRILRVAGELARRSFEETASKLAGYTKSGALSQSPVWALRDLQLTSPMINVVRESELPPRLRSPLSAALLTINVLSLDAIAVALTWQTALGRLVHCAPTVAERIVLAAVVGFIYLLDRQLDAAKLVSLCHATARHAAHRKFAVVVRSLALACLLVAGSLLPWMAMRVIIAGAALTLLTAMHLVCVQLAPRILSNGRKELSVGILFAAGCGIHAIARQPLNPLLLTATILTGSVMAFNCLTLGTWESESDRRQGWASLQGRLRTDDLPRLGGWLMLIGFAWAVAANRLIGESVAAAALLLIALNHVRRDRDSLAFRVLADLVLLTPLLWL